MRLTDTHTHFYLQEFEEDFEQALLRARAAGVTKFYLPGIDSTTADRLLALEELYPSEFFAMAGLHPCSVKEDFLNELKIIEKYLSQRKFAAIGEIGLDFYHDETYKNEQFIVFNAQMELALQYKLPIVIHTRHAMRETIEAVKPFAAKGLTGIFHCFGDTVETARQIIDLGFYVGIGGVLTYKNSGLAAVVKDIPAERIVLETDAPYLSPVPVRGRRNESSYITYIAAKLAEIKNLSIEEIAEITSANAEKIFSR